MHHVPVSVEENGSRQWTYGSTKTHRDTVSMQDSKPIMLLPPYLDKSKTSNMDLRKYLVSGLNLSWPRDGKQELSRRVAPTTNWIACIGQWIACIVGLSPMRSLYAWDTLNWGKFPRNCQDSCRSKSEEKTPYELAQKRPSLTLLMANGRAPEDD